MELKKMDLTEQNDGYNFFLLEVIGFVIEEKGLKGCRKKGLRENNKRRMFWQKERSSFYSVIQLRDFFY